MKKIQLLTVVVMLVAFAVSQTCNAQIVPFRASGNNATYSQPFAGGTGATYSLGQATHMGRIEGSGIALPTGSTWATVGDYTLRARNGDSIYLNGGGTVEIFDLGGGMFYAVWTGQFQVVGGTGRFANVGPGMAPIEVVAINDPFTLSQPTWTYSWTLRGDINLGRR